MSLKRSSIISFVSDLVDPDQTSKKSKNLTKSRICQVCGDKASIINYGALTCESCKVFFRRNGYNPENVRTCLFDGACEIDINTRRSCTACRLAKCRAFGMSSDFIRKEVRSNTKCLSTKNSTNNQPMINKEATYISQSSVLNLAQNDLLTLNNSEWTLLSNVIHAYDTFSSITELYDLIQALSTSSSSNMFYNVSNLYEVINLMYKSMQSFISSAPDFRILTSTEQYSLYERNLHGVIALHSILFIRSKNIIDNPKCMNAFANLYGLDLVHQIKRINKELDLDLNIIKIMLIILAFSSNCFFIYKNDKISNDSLLNGTFRLYGSQNVYVELLWKYMIYRYGYYQTVNRFCRLIQICLVLIKYYGLIYINNQTHYYLVEHIFEQTKKSLSINQNEQRSLWGKP